MTRMESYYTPEQLQQLEQRRLALGEEGMRKAQQDWADLYAAVEAERQAGTEPGDPRLDPLVARWQALIEAFTGGDPGIRASLQRMYEQEGTAKASRGMVDPETQAWFQQAIAARQA
jgi:hypothetical protein